MENRLTMNPVDDFLAQAEKSLRGRLTPEKVAATLTDARQRMTRRAEELTSGGLKADAAIAAAAAAFGTPRQWARDVLQAAGYRAHVKPANRVSIASYTLCLLTTLMSTWGVKSLLSGEMHFSDYFLIVGLVLAPLAAFAAPVGALIAGRCEVKTLTAIMVAMALLSAIAAGMSAPALMSVLTNEATLVDFGDNGQEHRLLQLGVQTYADMNNIPAALPKELKGANGYLAPKMTFHPYRMSAFVKNPHVSSVPLNQDADDNGMVQVATKEKAARQWHDFGAARLAECEREGNTLQREVIESASVVPASFSFSVAWKAALFVLVQGALGLGLCLLFAKIGESVQKSHRGQSMAG